MNLTPKAYSIIVNTASQSHLDIYNLLLLNTKSWNENKYKSFCENFLNIPADFQYSK